MQDENKFNELYNTILSGDGDWDYSTLDELILVVRKEGIKIGVDQLAADLLKTFNELKAKSTNLVDVVFIDGVLSVIESSLIKTNGRDERS